jgi:hypothetical protein
MCRKINKYGAHALNMNMAAMTRRTLKKYWRNTRPTPAPSYCKVNPTQSKFTTYKHYGLQKNNDHLCTPDCIFPAKSCMRVHVSVHTSLFTKRCA